MSKNNNSGCKFEPLASITDAVLLQKILMYLVTLRPILPSPRLKDCCSGALALIYELSFYLDKLNISDYGNHKK